MRVLISGVLGQDGHYLAKQLTEEGHEVFGLVHRQKVQELPFGKIVRGDLADTTSIFRAVEIARPHEIYNMGAVSHVQYSFMHPEHTMNVNGLGLWRLVEAAKHFAPDCRIYQASTAELFGNSPPPCNEDSVLAPVSPYGVAKLAAHRMAAVYRKQALWVSCGILFSHVSPRSGTEFIMNKFIQSAIKVRTGESAAIPVGSLSPRRDFGWSPEYCDGIIRILRYTEPTDMVLATGVTVGIGELGEYIFARLGLDFKAVTYTDPTLIRPTEIEVLEGDDAKAREAIGWNPQHTWKWIAGTLLEQSLKPVAS